MCKSSDTTHTPDNSMMEAPMQFKEFTDSGPKDDPFEGYRDTLLRRLCARHGLDQALDTENLTYQLQRKLRWTEEQLQAKLEIEWHCVQNGMDNDGDDEVVIDFTDFADPTSAAENEGKLQTEFPVLSAIDTNCSRTSLTRRSRNRHATAFPVKAATSSLFSSVTATAATAAAAMKEVRSAANGGISLSTNLDTLREAARAKHEEAQALSQAMLSSGRSAVSTAASQASEAAAACATTVTATAAQCEAAAAERLRGLAADTEGTLASAADFAKRRYAEATDPYGREGGVAEDILSYDASGRADNAAAYRRHEMCRDVHDDWLRVQAGKDVRGLLAARKWRRLPRDLDADIVTRAGVLPAPTGVQRLVLDLVLAGEEDDEDNDDDDAGDMAITPAQRRAARERLQLESSIGSKRKKTQLLKMRRRSAVLVKLDASSTARFNQVAIERKLKALEHVQL